MNAVLYFERVGVRGRQTKPVGIFVLDTDGMTRQEAEALLDARFEGPEGLVRIERVIIVDHQQANSIEERPGRIGPIVWKQTLELVLVDLNFRPEALAS